MLASRRVASRRGRAVRCDTLARIEHRGRRLACMNRRDDIAVSAIAIMT
jgi:hypothetical protein